MKPPTTFKHIRSKNADYGAAEQYLTSRHDEFTIKPTLDGNGQIGDWAAYEGEEQPLQRVPEKEGENKGIADRQGQHWADFKARAGARKGGGIMNGKRPYMDYRQHRAEQKSLKPLETKIPQKTAQKPEWPCKVCK